MYDVVYIDAHGAETPVARQLDDRQDAAEVARKAAAERGVGRMVLPGSSKLPNCVCVIPVPPARGAWRAFGPGLRRRSPPVRGESLGSPPMRVGVIGGGLMGSGIAEVCARSGVDVTVVEVDEARAERARGAIEKSLGRGVRSGKLSEADRDAALEHLVFTPRFEDIEGADAAIEAVIEDEGLKQDVFRRLDEILPDARFLASNTSSVPIMKLGAQTKHPGRVLGMHFFNPVPVLPLVELVTSIMTEPTTVEDVREFAQGTLGKTCIDSQDRAGF